MPGVFIGPYRFVSLFGRGAMGAVWRARDERLDRYVALKVLPRDLAGDVERRARMLREARAAAAIRHASVVTLFDVVGYGGEDILVMELVEGRTLSEVLRKDGPPPLATGLAWIERVADALVAAHARGILHRDIKAANIMVTAEGVKVLDFGLAKLRDGDEPEVATAATRPMARATDRAIALDETMASEPHPIELSLDQTAVAPGPSGSGSGPSGSGSGPSGSGPSGSGSGPSGSGSGPSGSGSGPSGSGSGPSGSGPSGSGLGRGSIGDPERYRTQAGQLLGTPLYMAPEQIAGGLPDERSEVFSVGVLAYEILAGRPPYSASTVDELFRQIARAEPPELAGVPESIEAIVARALAKDPAARWPTMQALRDAIAAEHRRRSARPSRRARWALLGAGALALALGAGAVAWWSRSTGDPPPSAPAAPGDDYVARALDEYDVFYNDKAMSSLRAALAVAPAHPRANAYVILFGGASDADRDRAIRAAHEAHPRTAPGSRDRALLDAAIALVERGPRAARTSLGAPSDRELAFWAAELDYRAGQLAAAREGYRRLLEQPARALRGRIYDHYSSVLLYLDEPTEALQIGQLYRDAFPGEADAVGVHATTLAAAGRLDEAIAAAEEAVRLSEGEDTLAGLAKVVALSGDRARARELYQRSLERAGPKRRPVRRAALALLQWIDGDASSARATVAPCLAGGSDATVRERGACLFVAGVIDRTRAAEIAGELDALAAEATELRPAYGAPASLAALVRARAVFFGGGCVVDPKRADLADLATAAADPAALDVSSYVGELDFYAAYHVPFFATWAACEYAAVLAARGQRAEAIARLTDIASRAPHRDWIRNAIKSYE
ncbi:MAG: protein kinase domain-containing protein [Kofleriaceae bacterium]